MSRAKIKLYLTAMQYFYLLAFLLSDSKDRYGNLFLAFYLGEILESAMREITHIIRADKRQLTPEERLVKGFLKRLPNSHQLERVSIGIADTIHHDPNFLSKIPSKIANELTPYVKLAESLIPEPIKEVAASIKDTFTKSTTQLIIDALKNGKVKKNVHIELTSLTSDEASELIKAIDSKNAPAGLEVSYPDEHIPNSVSSNIQKSLVANHIKHAALACVTLQQGYRDENSICSSLPNEILQEIYEYAFPFPEEKAKQKNFVRNVASYFPGFFDSKRPWVIKIAEDYTIKIDPEFKFISNLMRKR